MSHSKVKNIDIRAACILADMALWELAYIYGISDTSFSRLLRQEFPKEEKEYLLKIIDEYKNGKDPEILRYESAIRRIDKRAEKRLRRLTMDRYSPIDKEDYDRHTAQVIKNLHDHIKESLEE